METIFLSKSRRTHFGKFGTLTLVVSIFAMLAGSFYLGLRFAPGSPVDSRLDIYSALWQQETNIQRNEVRKAIGNANDHMDALALRLGELQSQVVRLNALGTRLVDMAYLDTGEFNFEDPPPRGGRAAIVAVTDKHEVPDFLQSLTDLESLLADRAPKLGGVENELMSRKLEARVIPAGRPVERGWISSKFGYRSDPFTGRRTFHYGLDLAGRRNTEIVAVAAGVVIWSGRRSGFGNVVEINHGGGYSTLYAHNSKNLSQVGDTVKKGQAIALMGSTGHSTGTHVHFEVRKDGKPVNPMKFVQKAAP